MISQLRNLTIDSEECSTELCAIGKKYGSDKTPLNEGQYRHAYTPIYQLLFSPIRYQPIHFAEIGIEKGNSLRMFREFFPLARILGIDNKPEYIEQGKMMKLKYVELKLADAKNSHQLIHCFQSTGNFFDVIIDDSSHEIEVQTNVIKTVIPFLKPGGFLIVEDIFMNPKEGYYEQLLDAIESQNKFISFYTFLTPKNTRTQTGGWNNDRLLLIIK